jgi:hypothetical protein
MSGIRTNKNVVGMTCFGSQSAVQAERPPVNVDLARCPPVIVASPTYRVSAEQFTMKAPTFKVALDFGFSSSIASTRAAPIAAAHQPPMPGRTDRARLTASASIPLAQNMEANVMTKMQAGNLSELVRFAIRAGIVDD